LFVGLLESKDEFFKFGGLYRIKDRRKAAEGKKLLMESDAICPIDDFFEIFYNTRALCDLLISCADMYRSLVMKKQDLCKFTWNALKGCRVCRKVTEKMLK
ncbi:hypothetical protein HDV05_003254, partial [Chytridiales sp. JEL 0842]